MPDNYFQYLTNLINCFNQGNNKEYKIEKYHIDFIFTCLQCFKYNIITKGNIKEILIKHLSYRILTNRRGIPLKKIIAEHYIYCDLGLCINIHFFGDLNKNNIIDLISLYYQRMEKIPNTDYDLNIKLCINIFLLLLKIDNYEIYDEFFLINKKVNLYTFINKVISFFPVNILSLVEQQIIAIFCSTIIRYLILKQKNNQEVLIYDKMDLNYTGNNYEKIYYYIFVLNLNQIHLIKQKSVNILKKMEKKEEMDDIKNKERKIVINSYEINETNGKEHFKKNIEMIFPEREPHNKSIINKTENDNDNNNSYFDDFFNDDEFLIINEYNKRYNNEENEEYNDENENYYLEDNEEEDDRDEDFLTLKKEYKNSFLFYYNKFANEKLIVSLKQINEFQLFQLMMKDLELSNKNILKEIFDKIQKMHGIEKLKLIEKYKGIQKIYFPNKDVVSYRRIVRIIRKNNNAI